MNSKFETIGSGSEDEYRGNEISPDFHNKGVFGQENERDPAQRSANAREALGNLGVRNEAELEMDLGEGPDDIDPTSW